MTEFSFTASAECEYCGSWLSSSDAECDDCSTTELRRFHFVEMVGDGVETVFAPDPPRAWLQLNKVVDDPLPYRLYESDLTSLEFAKMGFDVADDNSLRR